MKIILRQFLYVIGALVVLYAMLLVITLLLVPRSELGNRLNTARASSSLFLTEPKYAFLARSKLNSMNDKAILLGASNMLVGFRQAELQALVPKMEVHNLSVGGSNITQIDQIVGLIREVQAPEARRHTTFVIGIWYGVFVTDKARWYTPDRHAGDTDIDIERYRYGFYRRTENGPVPLLPPADLDLGVMLIHPYLVLDRTVRDVSAELRNVMFGRKPRINDAQRNAIVLNEAQKQGYLSFWRDYMGGVDALEIEPFQALEKMVVKILADGGRVVLVDLPIPNWHADRSPLWRDYHRHVDPLLSQLETRSGITVLRMGDSNNNDDFIDEVHPKPLVTSQWSKRLAGVLNLNAYPQPKP